MTLVLISGYEFSYDNLPVVIFEIDAARNIPVKFSGEAFIRVGSYKKKLKDYPEKERRIWRKKTDEDWSAKICPKAAIADLSPEAIKRRGKNIGKSIHTLLRT